MTLSPSSTSYPAPYPVFVGVDPGATGAIAAVSSISPVPGSNKLHTPFLDSVMDLPFDESAPRLMDPARVLAWLGELRTRYGAFDVVIERAQAAPGQGVSTAFAYGMSFGQIVSISKLVARDVIFVAPVVWKRRMLLTPDKDRSREVAVQHFGDLPDFKRKRDHNRAEAALLALYAWRFLGDRHNPET